MTPVAHADLPLAGRLPRTREVFAPKTVILTRNGQRVRVEYPSLKMIEKLPPIGVRQ